MVIHKYRNFISKISITLRQLWSVNIAMRKNGKRETCKNVQMTGTQLTNSVQEHDEETNAELVMAIIYWYSSHAVNVWFIHCVNMLIYFLQKSSLASQRQIRLQFKLDCLHERLKEYFDFRHWCSTSSVMASGANLLELEHARFCQGAILTVPARDFQEHQLCCLAIQ